MAKQVLQSPKNPHFFQPILPGSESHLEIPEEFFLKHIEGTNVSNKVELRSDACEKPWKVEMDGRRLTVGWKEFHGAHDFRVGDIIVFRHEGDFVFHVTGLGQSCCEIQYVQENIGSLPTKQNVKTEQGSSSDVNDNMGKFSRKKLAKKRNIKEEVESFSSDQDSFIARVTNSSLRDDTLLFPKKFVLNKGSENIVLTDEEGKTWTLNLSFRERLGTFYMSLGWKSFCLENKLKPGDSITFKLERNNTKKPLLCFSTSESKSVLKKDSSKEKKRKTVESSQSENRFVTLTVTSSALKNSRLHLPTSFVKVHEMEKAAGKEIIMLDNHGVEWPVYLSKEKRYTRLRFGPGLKDFFKAIGIKANESFVLELVWEDKANPPMLKFCSKIKTLILIALVVNKHGLF